MIKIVPTTETSIYDLLGVDSALVTEVHLQADSANVAVINFGPTSNVDHFLEAGGSAILPVNNLKAYFVKGNGTDLLIISIYRR